MKFVSVDNVIKRARTIPNYYIESHELEPDIIGKTYIFTISPISDEMCNMALCSKNGSDIQNLIESYCLCYEDSIIGIRNEAYFTIEQMFKRTENEKNYMFLEYSYIPLYFLRKNIYLKVVVKDPTIDLVLFISMLYQVTRIRNLMQFKIYDYKLDKIPICQGVNILNITENKHIEFIVLKTTQSFNNIALETNLMVTEELPYYYKYTTPYYENLTPQKDMYLIPISFNPSRMHKCSLVLDSSSCCSLIVVYVSKRYLQYDINLKNIYEVFNI